MGLYVLRKQGVNQMAKPSIESKLQALKRGDKVICSNDDLDSLEQDDTLWRMGLRSIPNPNQVGTKDLYIVWAGKEDPEADCRSELGADL